MTYKLLFVHTVDMSTTTASLRDIVHAAELAPGDLITHLLERLPADHRLEFVRGLSERLHALSGDNCERNVFEIDRWVGSWLLSLELSDDAAFVASDRDATMAAAAGDLGPGATMSDLRGRYGR